MTKSKMYFTIHEFAKEENQAWETVLVAMGARGPVLRSLETRTKAECARQ